MKAVEEHDPRPQWVRDVIARLWKCGEEARRLQEELDRVGLLVASNDMATGAGQAVRHDVGEARHELEHVWHHITSTRRGFRMAWPWEPGDREGKS